MNNKKLYVRSVKKSLALVGICCFTTTTSTRMLEFIDNTFEDFINRVVLLEDDKARFKKYYQKVVEKFHDVPDEKKRAVRQYLYQVGWSNLEKKHEAWHKEITPFFTDTRFTVDESFDPVRQYIRRFVSWYGAYQEYLHVKSVAEQKTSGSIIPATAVAQENTPKESSFNIWQTIKDYALGIKDTVFGWFNFGKSPETVS